jgi:hypothetical protein
VDGLILAGDLMRLAPTALVAAAALVGVAGGLGLYTFVYAKGHSYITNDPAACSNCHVMSDQHERPRPGVGARFLARLRRNHRNDSGAAKESRVENSGSRAAARLSALDSRLHDLPPWRRGCSFETFREIVAFGVASRNIS